MRLGDDRLVAVLRGETPTPLDGPESETGFLAQAHAHGVQPLLARALRDHVAWPCCPVGVRRHLERAAVAAAAVAELQRQATERVLRALERAGVRPLVFKGGHLAYSHYADPSLRPRADTDLLVRLGEAATARTVLESLGYQPATHTSGRLVTHQCPYARTDRFGVHHAYDLHWKLAEPHLFADLLTFDEMEGRAVDLIGYAAPARAPSDMHALVIACLHRVAHHNDSGRLLWFYDIHQLVERMDGHAARRFADLAVDRRIAAVCADTLQRTRDLFGTDLPPGLVPPVSEHVPEPSAAFLGGRLSRVDQLGSDLKTLDGWSPRWRLLREHLFPSRAYMRRRYPGRSPVLLPVAYLLRLLRGAGHWFRPIAS